MIIASMIVQTIRRACARAAPPRRSGPAPDREAGACEGEDLGYALMCLETAPRMSRMRAVFGLAEDGPWPERWRSERMVRACATCAHTRACDRTLRRLPAGPGAVAFCPNRAHYAALAARAQ